MSKRKRSKGESRYIKFKATGKIVVRAKTKEEALRKAREKFQEYLDEVDEDDSFPRTGLDKWLVDEMLLGMEKPTITEEREDDIEIRWTNIPREGKKDRFPKGKVLRRRKDE